MGEGRNRGGWGAARASSFLQAVTVRARSSMAPGDTEQRNPGRRYEEVGWSVNEWADIRNLTDMLKGERSLPSHMDRAQKAARHALDVGLRATAP